MFGEVDQEPDLAKRIVDAELAAIVSWFVLGAQRVLAHGGYTIPPSSAQAVDSWRRNADQVRAFVDACTQQLAGGADTKDGEPAEHLYRTYRRWAENNGHRPMASNKFAERMAQLGLPSTHTRYGNFYAVTLQLQGQW